MAAMLRVFAACVVMGACVWGTCSAQSHAAHSDPAGDRFKQLDVNHDGVVSQYEYDSDAAILLMDANHDDHVSGSELQTFIGPHPGGTKFAERRMARGDMNGDKQLSDEELRRALKFRFEWLDRNKDGNVDLEEMRRGFGAAMLN